MNYNKIDDVLHERKIDKKDLVSALKITKAGYYNMVKNETMTVKVFVRLCEFFKVPMDYWFDESKHEFKESIAIYNTAQDKINELNKTIADLRSHLETKDVLIKQLMKVQNE